MSWCSLAHIFCGGLGSVFLGHECVYISFFSAHPLVLLMWTVEPRHVLPFPCPWPSIDSCWRGLTTAQIPLSHMHTQMTWLRLCSLFSVPAVSRQAHVRWCLSTLPHNARHVKIPLKLWLKARVGLYNGCQGCPTEDCPLGGRLAATHVAGRLCLFIWSPPRAGMAASRIND